MSSHLMKFGKASSHNNENKNFLTLGNILHPYKLKHSLFNNFYVVYKELKTFMWQLCAICEPSQSNQHTQF